MNFLPEQNVHVEEEINDRAKEAWAFRHSVPGQAYALLCIVSPGGTRQTSQMQESAIKIFGCFPTLDSANAEAAKISEKCDFFDVYVCSANDWVAVPPDYTRIEDVKYRETRLQNLQDAMVAMRTGKSKEMVERIKKDHEIQKQLKESKDKSAGSDGGDGAEETKGGTEKADKTEDDGNFVAEV